MWTVTRSEIYNLDDQTTSNDNEVRHHQPVNPLIYLFQTNIDVENRSDKKQKSCVKVKHERRDRCLMKTSACRDEGRRLTCDHEWVWKYYHTRIPVKQNLHEQDRRDTIDDLNESIYIELSFLKLKNTKIIFFGDSGYISFHIKYYH